MTTVAAAEGVQPVHSRPNGEHNRRASAYKTPAALIGMKEKEPAPRAELPRSASYTYMPNAAHHQHKYVNTNIVSIHGSFTEEVDSSGSDDAASPPDSSGWNTPDGLEIGSKADSSQDLPQDLAAQLRNNPKIVLQKLADEGGPNGDAAEPRVIAKRNPGDTSAESTTSAATATTTKTSTGARPSVGRASSFATKLNRRSWTPSFSRPNSRSPSPVKKKKSLSISGKSGSVGEDVVQIQAPTRPKLSSRKSILRRKDSSNAPQPKEPMPTPDSVVGSADTTPDRPTTFRRKSISLRNKLTRPTAALLRGKSADEGLMPPVPDVPTYHKSFSTERLPSTHKSSINYDRSIPVPRLTPGERTFSGSHISLSKKKDELWSVFRSLDGDYTKFSSKSVALKANVLRSTLLPFLREYAIHPSNSTLRPEDLDRRASILNKWWCGLLEMLHGRNNQSISGTDRPAILDGISGIMERPEWRMPPSPFSSLMLRDDRGKSYSGQSCASASSSTSDFLTESVHHNVRNIFLQNLSAQMAFVVDKMTMRNASASLVTFCGKACAYAFMFVPGMADILVRVWDLSVDTLRRVLEENGIGKFEKMDERSQTIANCFPPALWSLDFLSLPKMMRKLRTPPPLPLGTNHINWWGYWLERWTGRESDLFYVFVKHYHILVADFLPPGSTKSERMCVPGMLMVHGQILTNLDSTIHRDAKPSGKDAVPGSSPTFDDVFTAPDAVASTIPALPANATRIMAENRLIMLIRDFISERSDHTVARHLFAESFNGLLQSATRGTSVFDHSACYTLLDFLEEALVILARFEHVACNDTPLIDSKFWATVCKRIASSENTLTEIRLYAFLYTIWNTMASKSIHKDDMCTEFLLDPDIFESRFNHWCPMVRAYYMRLLCWRVGRFDGEALECDLKVLGTMHDHLSLTWSHYLWLREDAVQRHAVLPPTNPCNPAPSRRLLIIRTDAPTHVGGGSFISFDGFVPPNPSSHLSAAKRFSENDAMMELESRPSSSHSMDENSSPPKGIRSIIRNMMTSRNRPKSPVRSLSDRVPTEADAINDAQHNALNRSPSQDRHRNTNATTLSMPDPSQANNNNNNTAHRNFSFKFSLDYHPNVKAPGPIRLFPPRLPKPAQEFFLQGRCAKATGAMHMQPMEPKGQSRERARYTGRALAEWMMVVGECQSFFERRKTEGILENRLVETPMLGVEVFKRGS
jgi:hypothetical protein